MFARACPPHINSGVAPPPDPEDPPTSYPPLTDVDFIEFASGGDVRVALSISGLVSGNKVRLTFNDDGVNIVTNHEGEIDQTFFDGSASPTMIVAKSSIVQAQVKQFHPGTLAESALAVFSYTCVLP